MRLVARLAVCSSVLAGCASCPQPAPPTPASAGAPGESPVSTLPASAVEPSVQNASTETPAPAAAASEPPAATPAPGESLPEVTVQNVGLHIGGSPNDDAAKAPFKRALEPHFDTFRRCYVHIEEPGKGGTFGVDLMIGRDGGKPEVRQPRTGLKGQKFRECMVQAFENVVFEKPKAPTVISYSLRFAVGGR